MGSLLVTLFVLSVLTVPSGFHGWLPTALWILPSLLLLMFGTGIGSWRAATATAVAAAVAIGVWDFRQSAPIHERIEAVADEVGIPAGWTAIGAERWVGSTWGLWQSWPEVDYTYVCHSSPQEAASLYASQLTAAGWERQPPTRGEPPSAPGTVADFWQKGRWNVEVRIAGPGSWPRQYDTLAPRAQTRVDLYFDGQR